MLSCGRAERVRNTVSNNKMLYQLRSREIEPNQGGVLKIAYPENEADGKDGNHRHKQTRKGYHNGKWGLSEHALGQHLSTNVFVSDVTLSHKRLACRR